MTAADSADEGLNWPEDFAHENGRYNSTCYECGKMFVGHKRRLTCKLCATPAPVPSADELSAEDIVRELNVILAAMAGTIWIDDKGIEHPAVTPLMRAFAEEKTGMLAMAKRTMPAGGAGAVPSEQMVGIVLQEFRKQIDIHMALSHPSSSPGHDAMRIALRKGFSASPIGAGERETDEKVRDEICFLIGQIFFHGGFKAETWNEHSLELRLRKLGYFYETQEQASAASNARTIYVAPALSATGGDGGK